MQYNGHFPSEEACHTFVKQFHPERYRAQQYEVKFTGAGGSPWGLKLTGPSPTPASDDEPVYQMSVLRAEHFLRDYDNCRLADVYDDDDMLRSALATLFPDFEYPDFSWLSIREIHARYLRHQQPLFTHH